MATSTSVRRLQNAATALGDGTPLRGNDFHSVLFQRSGGATATVTWEASVDGTNWVAVAALSQADGTTLATTATADGLFRVDAAPWLRARISAYTSGSVTVDAAGFP